MIAAHSPGRTASRIDDLRLMKIGEVTALTSLCRMTIYRMIRDGTFPAQIAVSPRRVAWRARDIHAWLETRLQPAA